MFTKTEETILNALPKKYKCVFRNRDGDLRIGEGFDGVDDCLPFTEFNHLFEDVKAGARPIYFRKQILDDTEREYLKTVFKPFASRIEWVKKQRCNEMWEGMEYITVIMTDPAGDSTCFPTFKAKTMYKGMMPNKAYTLEELGITYD